jgi:hypothetical protein
MGLVDNMRKKTFDSTKFNFKKDYPLELWFYVQRLLGNHCNVFLD